MPYFERIDTRTFRATEYTSGAWREDEQHIAPALGLLAHLVEQEHATRHAGGPLFRVTRLTYDILGTLAIDRVTTEVRVLRAGRTIELVEARMAQGGRDAVILRAWLQDGWDTAALAGTPLTGIPGPGELPEIRTSDLWPGGFIRSVEVRREVDEPGRGRFWVRTSHPLLAGEEVSRFAAAVGLLDIANGMSVRVDPSTVVFPNLDLSAHFFRAPGPGWLGFDTSVSFADTGIGLTSSVLHDEQGPIGTLAQILTVRPIG